MRSHLRNSPRLNDILLASVSCSDRLNE